MAAKTKASALKFSANALATLERRVVNLDKALREALARKPNQGLQDLVDAVKQCAYQMKAQRAELDDLVKAVQANTTVVGSLVGRAPTVPAQGAGSVTATVQVDNLMRSQEAPLKTV